MNSNIKKYFIYLFILLSFSVRAANIEFNITGDQVIAYGDKKIININAKLNGQTLKKLINIELKSNDPALKLSLNSGACTYSNNELACGEEGITEDGVIASIAVKAPVNNRGEYTISLNGFSEDEKGRKSPVSIKYDIRVASNISTVDNIKINGEALEGFDKDKFAYVLNVGGDIDEAKIDAVLSDNSATFMAGYGPRKVELLNGDNIIKVKVNSESGGQSEYEINVNRQDNRKTDSFLKEILIDNNKIENFKKDKYNYNYIVYNKKKIDITAETSDTKASFEVVGPEEMVAGENEYKIIVKSEKGDSSTYIVTIDNVDKKISKKLKSLTLIGYNLKFDKNNNLYKLEYKSEKMKDLKIYAIPEENKKYVDVVIKPNINKKGTEDIKAGSKIEIIVKGIDGEEEKYTIVFTGDSRLNFFLVLILLIIIGLAIYLYKIIKDKKKKTKTAKHDITKKKEEVKNKKLKVIEKPSIEVPEETQEIEVVDEDLEATKEIGDDFYEL